MPEAESTTSTASGNPMELLREMVSFLLAKRVLSADDVRRVLKLQGRIDRRFGSLAVLKGYVSPHDIIYILYKQLDSDVKAGDVAVRHKLMTPAQVKEVLLLQTNPARLFLEILIRTRTILASNLQLAMREFYKQKAAAGKVPAGHLMDVQDLIKPTRQSRLDADSLKFQLKRLRELAALPGVVHRVLGLLQNPHVEMQEVAQVIEGDPGLSIRLLRLANSAFFGLSSKVGTVHKALITLGVKNVQKTIITASVLEKFNAIGQQEAGDFWRHALLTSRWTHRLLELRNFRGELLDDGVMAGLLHDTGKLAIWQYFPEANAEIKGLVKSGAPTEEAEREVLGMPHAEIGAFLFQLWNFPAGLLQAACYHHASTAVLGGLKDMTPLTACVNAACRIAHLPVIARPEADGGDEGGEMLDASSLDQEFLAFHGVNADALVMAAPQVMSEAEEMLSSFLSQAPAT